MNTKKKNIKEKIDSLDSKLNKSPLPYINEDFEEIATQFKNYLIFLACKEDCIPLHKNSPRVYPKITSNGGGIE